MQARYVPQFEVDAVLDGTSGVWSGVSAEPVKLMGTPVGLQPTDAIRVAWVDKKIGTVEGVEVSAVHDGRTLAFRLSWPDATQNGQVGDTTSFPDGAAVLFPSVPGAPSVTMGAPGQPVTAWYWRADEDGRGRHVVAEGLGSTRTADEELVRGHGVWSEGRWTVVIARALHVRSGEPVAQLEPGQVTGYGVAIWEGSHGERAGIKAFSGDWQELRLEAAPAARR